MLKKTLYFGNPVFLNTENEQLKISIKNSTDVNSEKSVPIEDIGVVVIDHYGVVLTQSILSKLLENNVAVIICNSSHLPNGLLLNLDGNSVQTEKFKSQVTSKKPLLKQLWQQTIKCKIYNQLVLLKNKGLPVANMEKWFDEVKSGDKGNLEARASVYYWKNLFPEELQFQRDRYGEPPNNLLNYGYAILRAVVARALVGSGLLPTLGIFHKNKYNAYCLADDVMEPYRPYVDRLVLQIVLKGVDINDLIKDLKKELLSIPTLDVIIEGKRSPLMVGVQRTSSSLARCFSGEDDKILYPKLI